MYKCLLFIFCLVFSTSTLGCVCDVSANPINFGSVNPGNGSAMSFGNTISVTCNTPGKSSRISYTVTFSAGNSGGFSSRVMKNGANNLGYNVYKDSGYSQILGSGSSGTYTLSNSYKLGKNSSKTDQFNVYGQIPIAALTRVGSYNDNITVTLTYSGIDD